MNMHFRYLKGFDPWDIIIKNTDTNEEFALKNKYKSICPVCFYPNVSDKPKECHSGIESLESKISFITGHFYETDYEGNPLNWFGDILRKISLQPFKHSHEILKLILEEKISNSDWQIEDIIYATMVPTTNLQMINLFSEISQNINLTWIPYNKLFEKKTSTTFYKDRKEYVNNKYFLLEESVDLLEQIEKDSSLLIFDDVFHQGYTLGRIIELLSKSNFIKFKLVTIARTVPKSFLNIFQFP